MGGDLKDQEPWMKVAFLMAMLGFTLELFALVSGFGAGHKKQSTMACIVVSIVCFLTSVLLLLLMVYYEEGIKEKKVAKGFLAALLLAAGVTEIVGLATWADDSAGHPPAYCTTLGVLSGVLGVLGGIFSILDIADVKAG